MQGVAIIRWSFLNWPFFTNAYFKLPLYHLCAGNSVGPAYGTGYCDAQCPHDIKWINGEANSDGWNPSDNDINSGVGKYGTCCYELDIWEANSISSAYTNHPCGDITGDCCY